MLSKLKEKRDQNRNSEKGFTLVELAIVLVIAGIILVGVMKGTDAVNKAKVERMVSDMRGLQSTLQEFQKRTGRYAGDCDNTGVLNNVQLPVATSVLPAYTAIAGTALILDLVEANRVIAGIAVNGAGTANTVCDDTAGVEDDNNIVWNELRRAGVVDANRLPRELARHVMNDVFMVGSMQTSTTGEYAGVIVAYGIPVWMAEAIDASIDGQATMYGLTATTTGPASSGRVRLWSGSGAATITAGTVASPNQFTAVTGSYDEGNNDRDNLVAISFQWTTEKLIK